MQRRDFLRMAGAAAVGIAAFPAGGAAAGDNAGETAMYGLIGKMTATPSQRDALVEILLASVGEMPGCLSYVVANDPTAPDAIWITEVWDSQESHQGSLQLPAVRAAIAKARPLIAGFDEHHVTEPVGGHGLPGPR
jgi:quinol monooxygenase YgiN